MPAAIVLEGLAVISHNAVNEQITKANKRLAAGDFAGAIASSYTLTEHLLKLILRGSGVAYNENEGDIPALYKLVRESLNLKPAGEAVAAPLKPSCRPGGRSRAMAAGSAAGRRRHGGDPQGAFREPAAVRLDRAVERLRHPADADGRAVYAPGLRRGAASRQAGTLAAPIGIVGFPFARP